MNFKDLPRYPLLAAALFGTAPMAIAAAPAQTPPAAPAPAAPSVGATVYDPQGGEVGKIISIADGIAVIDTGTNKASVKLESIGTGPTGPAIGYTRAQLDDAVAAATREAAAKFEASLVPGATVKSNDGAVIGTITEVNAAGQVVVQRAAGGRPVALPKDTLALNAAGEVALMYTAAQFEEAIGKSAAATPTGNAPSR